MHTSFWHERWTENRIGFHQDEINPYLKAYWPHLNLRTNDPVLVPLCGKSKDLHWLHDQGHPVLGVELSPIAAEAFFVESNLPATHHPQDTFTCWQHNSLKILCGDFFSFTPSHTPPIAGVYDRAALIALPPDMRIRYAKHLSKLLPANAKILLISIAYPQHQTKGPPFSVPETEVQNLFQNHFQIQRLKTLDVLSESPRWQERGVSFLNEEIYLLQKE